MADDKWAVVPDREWGEVLEPGKKYAATVAVDALYPEEQYDLDWARRHLAAICPRLAPQGVEYRAYPVLQQPTVLYTGPGGDRYYLVTLIAEVTDNPEGVTGEQVVRDCVELSYESPFGQMTEGKMYERWRRHRRIVVDLEVAPQAASDEGTVPDPKWLNKALGALGEALKYIAGAVGVLGVAWLWTKFADRDERD